MAGSGERTDAADAPLYNTAAVVQRTGVLATTFRAWERRYGYPKPLRDPGGQRMYSERDIVGIRWLSAQTAHGVAISRAIAILRGGHATPESATPAATQAPRSFAALRADLMRALLEYGDAQADRVLREAFALFSVEDVCLQMVEPLLVEVGDRWHAGELSVADEHHVTSFVRARLFGLLSAYQRPDDRGPLVFTACAPEEWHEVGLLVVSLFLARRGVAVRYLGANLPLDDLARATKHHPPSRRGGPLGPEPRNGAQTARCIAHTDPGRTAACAPRLWRTGVQQRSVAARFRRGDLRRPKCDGCRDGDRGHARRRGW